MRKEGVPLSATAFVTQCVDMNGGDDDLFTGAWGRLSEDSAVVVDGHTSAGP